MYNLMTICPVTNNETPKRLTSDKIYFGSPSLCIVCFTQNGFKQLNRILSIGSLVARPTLKPISSFVRLQG